MCVNGSGVFFWLLLFNIAGVRAYTFRFRQTLFNPTARPFVSQQLRTSTPYKAEDRMHSQQQHDVAPVVDSAVHYSHRGTNACTNGYSNGAPLSTGPNMHAQPSPPPQQLSGIGNVNPAAAAAAAEATACCPPNGVDGRIWRSISAVHVAPMYAYENVLNRIVSMA